MTPTIIKAETWYFGQVITEWYCINTLRDTPAQSRISRADALATIRDCHLTLAYKDSNGEVYSGQGGCFARYLALKEICRELNKEQAELYYEEQRRIHNFLNNW